MNVIHRLWKEVVSWFRPGPVDGLVVMGEFTAEGPQFGVEIFNDDKTTMEFVVNVLQHELAMNFSAAVAIMQHIHDKGHALIPIASPSEAERIANAITVEARRSGYPLVCRAVSAQQAVPTSMREARGMLKGIDTTVERDQDRV